MYSVVPPVKYHQFLCSFAKGVGEQRDRRRQELNWEDSVCFEGQFNHQLENMVVPSCSTITIIIKTNTINVPCQEAVFVDAQKNVECRLPLFYLYSSEVIAIKRNLQPA